MISSSSSLTSPIPPISLNRTVDFTAETLEDGTSGSATALVTGTSITGVSSSNPSLLFHAQNPAPAISAKKKKNQIQPFPPLGSIKRFAVNSEGSCEEAILTTPLSLVVK